MPSQPLRVLCIHGVNTSERATGWQNDWTRAIENGLHRWQPERTLDLTFLRYNDLFKSTPLTAADYVEALARLLKSGISTAIGSLIPRGRAFGGVTQAVRWTAGMVVQWVDDAHLREQARARIADAIQMQDPEIILGHSLGSLLCYDAFVHTSQPSVIRGRTFISFGSQIGNPFVRDTFGGRLIGIEAKAWYHLFNRHDLETFTWPIRLSEPNFAQIQADFDLQGLLDHDAIEYLAHPGMVDTVWPEVLGPDRQKRGLVVRVAARERPASGGRQPRTKRRALLVGINEYPSPADRLEGCVNDVFLVSSLLQECGFEAEDIRVVLDSRATAKTILDRLRWLLDDARDGDERVFFYSGHGAQLAAYAPFEVVDHKDECLVPYDFDWSVEHAVTDNQFFDLYSQLPYGTRFVAMLDCCYSGGITRESGSRIRGLTPPDDIRHRDLRWDPGHEMWVERKFAPINRSLCRQPEGNEYLGTSGVDYRLGRAALLRRLPNIEYDKVRAELGHFGPYMPLVLEACGEGQLASEYRHGVTSYGAFTYSLARVLRDRRKHGKNLSFERLVRTVARDLKDLGYDQVPEVVGPRKLKNSDVPWKPIRVRRQAPASS